MRKAVILAAGRGTRLRPLTEKLPKVMIPVGGKPVLEYHIEQLVKGDVRKIFINLHYLPEKIQDYFKNGRRWGADILYSYEPEILGTAGAIKRLEHELYGEPFLVVYGDNFLEIDYSDFSSYSENKNGIGTVTVFEKKDVRGSGILGIDSEDRVLHFIEKPNDSDVSSHWVNAGVYYFQDRILEYIRPGFSDFGYDILPKIILQGEKLNAYKLQGRVWALDNLELLNELIQNKGG